MTLFEKGREKKTIKGKFVSVSLRDKLIFLFVGVMFIDFLLLGCIIFFNLYSNEKESVSDNIDTTIAAVSEVMDQSFLVTENLVLELAASNGVQKWLDDAEYYNKENPDFYLRKMELNRELNRILIYSNAKKLDVVEYAVIFNDGELLEYADIQLVGDVKIRMGASNVYEGTEKEEKKFVYTELITNPENVMFHIRKMRSDFARENSLTIMVAMNERDIVRQYENLVREEGEIVYLIDEKNRVMSSNREEEVGSYIDKAFVQAMNENRKEVLLDQSYMMTLREMRNLKGVKLVHLYPQKLLILEVLDGIKAYVILCIIIIVVCLVVAIVIGLRSTRFLNDFIWAMESVQNKNYDVQIKQYKNPEINSLGKAFNEMTNELRELIRNKYESQILLNEMEIRFLQHQMNPHFLFNVLLTIQIKAKRSNDETIYNMVSKLSALLRASIYTNNIGRITVKEELEYTEFYLYLQKMRFEDKIFYEIIVEDQELEKCMIPKFMIEPIVENAVIHGIENAENKGDIRIKLNRIGKDLLVVVSDNGAGFEVEKYYESMENTAKREEKDSIREKIGLRNVELRLRHIYGGKYRIKIESEINKGTTIYIRVPIEEE